MHCVLGVCKCTMLEAKTSIRSVYGLKVSSLNPGVWNILHGEINQENSVPPLIAITCAVGLYFCCIQMFVLPISLGFSRLFSLYYFSLTISFIPI